MGLRNLRERLEALNGTLEIRSAPGQGTEIRASVPLTAQRTPADLTGIRGMKIETIGPFMVVFRHWPELFLPVAALSMASTAVVRFRSAAAKTDMSPAHLLRLRLFRHQYVSILLALVFWLTCILPEHAAGSPNQLARMLGPFTHWLARSLRLASPLFLALSLWEGLSFFRLRRSPGAPSPGPGLPAWMFAVMLLALLASLPSVYFIPTTWPGAPLAGILFYAILYLGWELRRPS
jgi:hypothetical protein